MKSNTLSIATGLILCGLLSTSAIAQSPVDIGLYQNNNMLEVRVRPQAEFGGVVSSVVFTIKWDASSGASLGTIQQDNAMQPYIPMARSGNKHDHGSMNYQVYAGFGMSPLSGGGPGWVAGEEYVLATIPVTGKGEFEIVNDAWTAEAEHNANYYVSLGGKDMTGLIYKSMASADEDASVVIQPNPNQGQFEFTFTNGQAMDVTVEVMNSLGQSVFTDTMKEFQGTYRKEMDISSMSTGVYYLKVKRGEHSSVHKIVYR